MNIIYSQTSHIAFLEGNVGQSESEPRRLEVRVKASETGVGDRSVNEDLASGHRYRMFVT